MGYVRITNEGEVSVAVLVGDPAKPIFREIKRLAVGESALFAVQGDPDKETAGSEALGVIEDGPWVDEIILEAEQYAAENDGHDGSIQ